MIGEVPVHRVAEEEQRLDEAERLRVLGRMEREIDPGLVGCSVESEGDSRCGEIAIRLPR